jgi:hypothetical protein
MSSVILGSTASDPTIDSSSPDPASITGGIVPAASQAEAAVNAPSQSAAQNPTSTQPAPAQGGSRLARIVQAVANVASTALSGIPDRGRPSFVTGLGEGARAEQAVQATQQAIKFKNFDDQVRLAQLHNQDLALQNATQEQTDAHIAAELNLRKMANDMGVSFDTVANHGPAVVDHLTASTATNGAASVPAGTHVSGDGDSFYIPQNTQKTRDAQKQMYNDLAPALGLPALPEGAQFVPDKNTNFLTNKMLGYGLDGSPIKHQDLPGILAAEQAQRDQIAKNRATPNQLKALDNVIAIHQASLKALDEHKQGVLDDASQRKQDEQTNQIKQKGQQQRITNASKPQNAAGSIVGFDPQTNERVVVNANDPKASSLTQSSKVTPAQLDNWSTSQNQFSNVQLAVSRYDQAARKFAQEGKGSDIVGINSALNKTGIGDIQVGEWGVRVPGFSSVAEAASRVANSTAFKNLSPAGQDLVDKYFRMMSSIPEYQKAATGIGRTNKEMLDLELKNIPDPTMPPSIISNRLASFQEALHSNASRVPRIQGVPSAKEVQQHYQQSTPAPSGGKLGSVLGGNVNDYINSLQPTK